MEVMIFGSSDGMEKPDELPGYEAERDADIRARLLRALDEGIDTWNRYGGSLEGSAVELRHAIITALCAEGFPI